MNGLSDLPVWSKLTASQQAALSFAAVKRSFAKGALLHQGGADCTGLFLVLSGRLRAFTTSAEGKEITLYRLFERDICLFSASCIMNSLQFEVSITAEQQTEVLVIPSEVYKQLLEVSAPLSNFTSEVMASRFSEVMWLMEQVMWKSFDKRLASFLLQEARLEGSDTLYLTHEAIGNHLGNPREVVTRMLKYFANEGYLQLSRGTVTILDRKGLSDIAED